jgi:hypothetical protein
MVMFQMCRLSESQKKNNQFFAHLVAGGLDDITVFAHEVSLSVE